MNQWPRRPALLTKRDLLATAAGPVHRVHNFEGLQPFFSGNQGFAALFNGLAEIAELALKRFQRNRHRVARSAGHVLRHRGGLTSVLLNIPGGEFIAGYDRTSLGP